MFYCWHGNCSALGLGKYYYVSREWLGLGAKIFIMVVNNMTVEVSVIISVVSVVFAIFFGLSNRKRADTTDIEVKAKERAETNIKLDNIGKDVTDIKYDISITRKEVQCLSERMIVVEQSVKSAHHRIDGVEEKKE